MRRTIAYYSQTGTSEYPEDTWEEEMVVANAKDVFGFMKNCYLRDSSNRNNYPVISYWGENISFFEETYSVCNLGCIHVSGREPTNVDYYDEAKAMYLKWKNRVQKTLPKLRAQRERRSIEEKERMEFTRLKVKYGNGK